MQYFAPNFLDEALVVLERFGPRARVLAGGTLLGHELRSPSDSAEALVNIKRIAPLTSIELRGDTLHIGAAATAHVLAHTPLVRTHTPLVAQAAAGLGARQLRSVATIGGNLCSGHHSADLSTALLASDARIAYANARDGQNVMPVDRFLSPGFQGLGPTTLLTGIEIPLAAGKSAYVKMQTRRAFEMALISVAAYLRFDGETVADARIALGGAAPTPILATGASGELVGRTLNDRAARDAAGVAADVDGDPRDDERASSAYRRHLVRVLVQRALAVIAGDRSGGNGSCTQ